MRPKTIQPPGLYLGLLSGAMAVLLCLAAIFNWAVDPLQVFRRATFYTPHFSENQRYQTPGIARHYAQPIVILGTSHMENMVPSRVASALGESAVNMAIAGSSLREQQLALSLALATGKVKRVVWGIDYSALTWGDILVEEWGEFPDYLYRSDIRLLSRYLLSSQTLADGWRALSQKPMLSLEERNTWWRSHEFSRARVLAAWRHETAVWTPAMRETVRMKIVWPTLRAVLERRVFNMIRKHPRIHFDLVLPPYSMLAYANDFRIHDEYFFQRLLMRDALKQFAAQQSNVSLWDFQSDIRITANLDHYKDLEHFGLPINRLMLAAMTTPAASPEERDPLPALVRDHLGKLCGHAAPERAELCPPLVRCGLRRLEKWLADGGDIRRLLDYAQAPCE